LVIAIRHSEIGLLRNDTAGNLNKENNLIKKVIKEMKNRCKLAIGNNKEMIMKTEKHIDKLVLEWEEEVQHC